MKSKLGKFWKNNKTLFIFISLMLVFRSAVADWNDVPTGSMKPTIVEGDRLLVNKMAYDLRLPFSHISLMKTGEPKANDIVIFDSKIAGKKLVKRVIGIPGDRVSMKSNKLTVNGKPLSYSYASAGKNGFMEMTESNAQGSRTIRIDNNASELSSFSNVTVPQNHYLVLGDNRDNSADSRVIGFIPREEITGKAHTVLFSLNYNNYLIPRASRYLRNL